MQSVKNFELKSISNSGIGNDCFELDFGVYGSVSLFLEDNKPVIALCNDSQSKCFPMTLCETFISQLRQTYCSDIQKSSSIYKALEISNRMLNGDNSNITAPGVIHGSRSEIVRHILERRNKLSENKK